jgi:hypothetical protein
VLLKAGERLRAAHEDALAGGGADALREAADEERAAVDRLVSAAPEVLGERASPATVEKIRDTLHAAALDDEARQEVAAGRVVKERRATGLGPFGAPAPAAPRPAKKRAPAKKVSAADRKRLRAAQAALTDAKKHQQRTRRDRASAERALERARAALAKARERLEGAEEDAQAAQREDDQASAALERAESEVRGAGG